MTVAQSDIMRYIRTQFIGIRTEPISEGIVRVTDKNGATMDFGMNIFGDILEILPDGTKKVLARSDLPHDLDLLPTAARPKEWITIPY